MSNFTSFIAYKVLFLFAITLIFSCNKLSQFEQKPELEPLQQGLKTSAAIGYCTSIAVSAFKGQTLPDNVTYNKNTGWIYIKIDHAHPLPFNNNIGDIIVAGLWNNNQGVISILFGNFDLLGGNIKLYGLYAVPVMVQDNNEIVSVFAKQDIILGYGSDTILHLGNITDFYINMQMDRLNSPIPGDAFVAVKQNVWFLNVDQAGTSSNVLDDNITINGGGQILEVAGETGGVVYHAMIDTKINYSECTKNPISGTALSQNFKAGGDLLIDLGNSLLSFHNSCDGKAHVDFASGKYISYNGKDISLNLP